MAPARYLLAVALFGDLTRPGRDGVIQRRIVPQRTDRVIPRFDFLFAGKPHGLDRQPVRDWQHASTPASAEVPANDLGQRPAIADNRRNLVDHRFRRYPAEWFLPDRGDQEDARQ